MYEDAPRRLQALPQADHALAGPRVTGVDHAPPLRVLQCHGPCVGAMHDARRPGEGAG